MGKSQMMIHLHSTSTVGTWRWTAPRPSRCWRICGAWGRLR